MSISNHEKIKKLHKMMYKRKSIRKFDKDLSISEQELEKLKNEIINITPLIEDINVEFLIVDRKKTTASRGDYCLLMYSEEKPFYLENAGYMLEQMDLFFAESNIGVCWYGVAKPETMIYKNLKYVIMLAFGKCQPEDFRVNQSDFKRKPIKNIWTGNLFLEVANDIRIAPSGCNLQPWRIMCEENNIKVFREFNMSSFPDKKRELYTEIDFSLIDMGICLYYMDISLGYYGYTYIRELDLEHTPNEELVQIATYHIK